MAQSLEQGYEGIIKQSENIRRMIEHNARALEEVSRAHLEIQDGVAGVDLTIKTILEVSRDLRQMTGGLASAFSWFDEVLSVQRRDNLVIEEAGALKAALKANATEASSLEASSLEANALEANALEAADTETAEPESVHKDSSI
ncbi:MAG TPA: hypothetical protein ENI27_06435 [bacterium]|nr:hypothetical protein [bacterium]